MDAGMENGAGLAQAMQLLSLELDRARALRAELAALIEWHHWIGSSGMDEACSHINGLIVPSSVPRYSERRQMR